jgi:hypothetical protein
MNGHIEGFGQRSGRLAGQSELSPTFAAELQGIRILRMTLRALTAVAGPLISWQKNITNGKEIQISGRKSHLPLDD